MFALLQEPTIVTQSASWTTVALALIGIVPASIAAIISGMALLQGRENARVAALTDRKVDDVKKDSSVIIEKATEIHILTNSNLQKVTHELELANSKIAGFAVTVSEGNKKIEKLESMLEQLARHVVPASTGVAPLEEPLPVHDEEAVAKLDQLLKKK